ncbi:MAG: hypothetical protein AAF518_14245 [Spirochaetota bacterium]
MQDKLSYQIKCSQRIIIPNTTPYPLGAQHITDFSDYPAILSNTIKITNLNEAVIELVDYKPRTINTSVTTSHTDASGKMSSASHGHSTGSTTSQSNTYGASASLGFFGLAATGGVSASASHTSSSSHFQSESTGDNSGSHSSSSGGESMSVKDWACNSYLDNKYQNQSPTWVWGQQYPWDIVKYNNVGVDNPKPNTLVKLPKFIIPLLCDDSQALPPSQLSLFGIDFTMESVWIVQPNNGDTQVLFDHSIEYYTASHSFKASTNGDEPSVNATISSANKPNISSVCFDLCSYGLDPLPNLADTGSGGAIVGFIPSKFVTPPAPVDNVDGKLIASPFKIISGSNNLLIQDTSDYSKATVQDIGAGFSPSETALSVQFSTNVPTLVISVNFKVANTSEDYTLFMKHWKTEMVGVMLNITINGNSMNTITKYVDSLESEGGEKNLLTIALRNTDFGSIDYHDYLQLGFNTVVIEISPLVENTNMKNCGYQIRAISIEKS